MSKAELEKAVDAVLQKEADETPPLQCKECGEKFNRADSPGATLKCPKCSSPNVRTLNKRAGDE